MAAASAERLGRRIRQLRTEQGLTLDALAGRAGISTAMLSKMERGAVNPTLVVAVRVAGALGMTISQLVGVESRRAAVKVTVDQRMAFRDPETGIERQIFPAMEDGSLALMRMVLPAGSSTGEHTPHRRGTETYLLIEQGSVRAVIDGDEFILAAGDAFYFEGDVSHQFDNVGRDPCSFFVVSTGTGL
ncbi:MAG: helix-turn-helix domain-containing protein [Dehalococcoidia bacterium]